MYYVVCDTHLECTYSIFTAVILIAFPVGRRLLLRLERQSPDHIRAECDRVRMGRTRSLHKAEEDNGAPEKDSRVSGRVGALHLHRTVHRV